MQVNCARCGMSGDHGPDHAGWRTALNLDARPAAPPTGQHAVVVEGDDVGAGAGAGREQGLEPGRDVGQVPAPVVGVAVLRGPAQDPALIEDREPATVAGDQLARGLLTGGAESHLWRVRGVAGNRIAGHLANERSVGDLVEGVIELPGLLLPEACLVGDDDPLHGAGLVRGSHQVYLLWPSLPVRARTSRASIPPLRT